MTRAVLAVVLLALAGCARSAASAPPTETSAPGVEPAGFELIDVAVTGTDDGREIRLWLADTPELRGHGLMGVTDLGPADGMLFVFDDEAIHRFYMWNTPMPLSIAFFDTAGRFVGSTDMEPCLDRRAALCERYAPDTPFQSAIEVPRGDLDELGLGPETLIEIVPSTTVSSAPESTSPATVGSSGPANCGHRPDP